ncbi:MAG: universal stress protein [Bradymonadaceae bacterium]
MTVLAATDFSESSRTAVRQAAEIADRRGTELVLVHAVEAASGSRTWIYTPSEVDRMEEEWREAALERLEDFYSDLEAPAVSPSEVTLRVQMGAGDDGVLDAANAVEADLVVLGATGANRVEDALVGSTPQTVARRCPEPVLVVPRTGRVGPYEHVLAPVDFTDCSRESVERAISIARRDGAELTILHAYHFAVVDSTYLPTNLPAESIETYEQRVSERLERLVDSLDLSGVDCSVLRGEGFADEVIVDTVDEVGADAVVMGTHGRRGLDRLFLGSTATKVLRQMPTTVMTVRRLEED